MVPYADGVKDIIEAWKGCLTFWTDGSFSDKTQRAEFGVLEGMHAELEGRRHTATFLKVVSHPLQKNKVPN